MTLPHQPALADLPAPCATDARIADIAPELGYADAAHFTRAFRRWTKVTPSEFRSGLREARAEA